MNWNSLPQPAYQWARIVGILFSFIISFHTISHSAAIISIFSISHQQAVIQSISSQQSVCVQMVDVLISRILHSCSRQQKVISTGRPTLYLLKYSMFYRHYPFVNNFLQLYLEHLLVMLNVGKVSLNILMNHHHEKILVLLIILGQFCRLVSLARSASSLPAKKIQPDGNPSL